MFISTKILNCNLISNLLILKCLQHKHSSLMTKVNNSRQNKGETTAQIKMYDVNTKKMSKEKVI